MLNVVKLSVVMLSVIMLSVVMLRIIEPINLKGVKGSLHGQQYSLIFVKPR
jgi:hypothetical protein